MALEDIERLKDKINKDPNSKLFVPLAEEYKKAGMLDEAIEVLVKGLEMQPGYLSARVSLGKIFSDRGMMQEAQAEFEKVISAIPDNLYAHKKLAEIYRDLGENDKAVREFKTVLKLNPMDDWAAASLSEMEQGPSSAGEEPAQEGATPLEHDAPAIEEDIFDIPSTEPDLTYESTEVTSGPEDEKVPEFSSAGGDIELQGNQHEDAGEEALGGLSLQDEDITLGESPSGEIPALEEDEENISDISISEEDRAIWESHAESMKKAPDLEGESDQETPPAEEIDLWKPLYDMEEDTSQDLTGQSAEETPFEDPFKKEEITAEEISVPEEEEVPQEEAVPSVAAADAYIQEGKYFSAMNVYRKILASEPDNKEILQRMEELRALLKLLGKEKEELLAKLDSFLDGIRKRRDEFLGSA